MLRATLVQTLSAPAASALLTIPQSSRLVLAKSNGNVEVYSTDHNKFKLYQTYPTLLQSLHSEDVTIREFLYGDELSTIFVRCRNELILLNSSNLQVYDKVVDKRGISQVWLFETFVPEQTHDVAHNDSSNVINGNSDGNFRGNTISDDDTLLSDKLKSTFLLYTTDDQTKLRLLVWKGRTYKHMVEFSLPHSNEFIKSITVSPVGFIIATNMSVYMFEHLTLKLKKIERIVKRKYPRDMVSAVMELQQICNLKQGNNSAVNKLFYDPPSGSNLSLSEYVSHSSSETSSLRSQKTKRSTYLSNFWRRKTRQIKSKYHNMRFSFGVELSNSFYIIDGGTEKLFELRLGWDTQPPSMVVNDHAHFFERNSSFNNIDYLSAGTLLLYNKNTIRFVDFENGFVFLEQEIPEGIREVRKMKGTHFVVWTRDNQLKFFHYQVDDFSKTRGGQSSEQADARLARGSNGDTADDAISICSVYHSSAFYRLWKEVAFYNFFLQSPHAVELCASHNPQESLDVCAMKLRDLTVIWCLEIFDALKICMETLTNLKAGNDSNPKDSGATHRRVQSNESIAELPDDDYLEKVQEIVIKEIFGLFIEFWAPPQLVLLRTFPLKYSKLVETVTHEAHHCLMELHHHRQGYDDADGDCDNGSNGVDYEIPQELLRKHCIPYLTDTRRNLKNLLDSKEEYGIIWKYHGRSIPQNLEFFLLDRHGAITNETMLTLIDTVLFEIYMTCVPSMVGPFIRVENMCQDDIVVRELRDQMMYQELIDFYYQRAEHRKALEFLISLLDDGTVKSHDQVRDLIKVLIVSYLQRVPDSFTNELFHYTDRLIIYFGTTHEAVVDLLRSVFFQHVSVNPITSYLRVYEYIGAHDPALSVQYLENVIATSQTKDPELYTALIKKYLKNLPDPQTEMKLQSVLETTFVYDPEVVLRLLERTLGEYKQREESKENKSLTNFVKLLKTFPLERLKEHKKAVNILFDELSSYSKASKYCQRIYDRNEVEGKGLFLYFFERLIDRYIEETQSLRRFRLKRDSQHDSLLINFLHDNHSKLDILEILKRLPGTIPISHIREVLNQMIKSSKMQRDESRVEKGLLRVELINLTYELNLVSSECVKLDEAYKCFVCKKTFSTPTSDVVCWFKLGGKDYVVHYNCSKSLRSRMSNIKTRRSTESLRKTVAGFKKREML